MPAGTVYKEQVMWNKEEKLRLIRRIAALVLCALITVAYTPGIAYALENQAGETSAAEEIMNGEQTNAGPDEDAQGEVPVITEETEEKITEEEPAAEEPAAVEPADESDADNGGSKGVVQNTRGVASDNEPDMQKGADRAADNATVVISADDQDLLINESTNVRVTADGARMERIQFNDSYGFRDEDDPDDDNGTMYSTRVGFYDTGEHEVYARVKLEGNSEWIETEHITFTVTSNGTAGSFGITKVNDSANLSLEVTRGATLKIECEEAANANHYWVDVNINDGGDGPWVGHFADTDSNTIYFNTIELQPGDYHLSIGADGIGYGANNSNNNINLTVNKLVVPDGEVYLDVSNMTPETNEEITYSVYCPGADRIEVFPDYDRDRGWRESPGGESFSGRATYGIAGKYTIKAIAYNYDEENDEDIFIAESSKVITVTSNGPLNPGLPELPSLIIAGKNGLSFTVDKPEHADRFKVVVWFDKEDYEGDNNLFWDETDEDSLTVNIPEDKFEEGMTVRVRVEAWGRGYDWSVVETSIPVTAGISDAVTIEATDTEILVNEDIDVTVRTKGGAKIDRIQLFGGYDFWEEEDPDDDGTQYTRGLNFSDAGEFIVFARVRLAGSEEWISTEPIIINVTSNGRTGDFNIISVNEETDFELEVTRGETLIIKCEDADNASHYWIDAERYEDGDWGWSEDYAHSDGSTIYFNTIELEPGEYRLSAFANGTGYENSRSGNSILLTVKDMDIEPGEMYFDVSKDKLETCEEFTYAAYYPGAEWIKVFMDYEGNREWSNDSHGEDSFSERALYRSEGTYELVAIAYGEYDEVTDEHEILATESRTMTVTAPNGVMNIERPELPSLIVAGEDGLSFTVNKPENADGIKVDVWFDMDDYEGDRGLYWDETEGDSLTVDLPEDSFEEGMTVRVRVEAWGRGYNNSFVEAGIPVTGEASDELTITASKEDALVCEDITFVVDAGEKEIDRVQLFNGNFYWDEQGPDFDDNTRYTTVESFDTPGTYTVFAKVRLAGSDEWLTTPSVSIAVTASGIAGDFEITGVNGGEPRDIEVAQGELVSITYEAAEHADHYWIELRRNNGEWAGHWADTDQLKAALGTAELEPGEYIVSVGANGYGYENNYSNNSFRLKVNESTVPHDEMSLSVSKTVLDTCENFTLSAYCADAARIRVYLNYGDPEGDAPEDEFRVKEKDGPGLTASEFYENSGTYTIKAIAYDENDQIIDYAVEVVSVIAEYGTFDLGIPDLPEKICAASGLSFRVDKPEGAQGFRIGVCCHGDNYEEDPEDITQLFWVRTDDDFIDVSVPAEKIEPGKTIFVQFGAWGPGYDYTEEEFEVDAVEHEWGTPAYTWSEDCSTCTAVVKCSIDESHTKSQEAAVTSEDIPAKYDTKGAAKYTASFADAAFATQTKTVEDKPSLKEQAETAQAAAITAEGAARTAATEAKKAAATPGAGAVAAAKAAEEAAKAFETAARDAKEAADKAYAAALEEYGPDSANPDPDKVSEAKTAADNAQTLSDNAKDSVASASQSVKDAEAAKAKADKAAADAAAAKKAEDARQGIPDSKIAKVKISKPAAGKKAVTAKWKKLTSKQIKKGKVKKYEIWVCPNKAFGPSDTIMKEVSKSKSSGKVKVPKKGTYYVKVRAIRKVGGVKYVGKWSSPKKVKVKK